MKRIDFSFIKCVALYFIVVGAVLIPTQPCSYFVGILGPN